MLYIRLVNGTKEDRTNTIRFAHQMRSWLIVKTGKRPDLYLCDPERWFLPLDHTNVWRRAIEQMLHKDTASLFLIRGAGGFAGGHPDARVAVVGDAVLDGLAGNTELVMKSTGFDNPDLCTREAQTGAAIHEALHLYRLDHEEGGVMSEWWKWPSVALPREPVGLMTSKVNPFVLWWNKRALGL